MEILTFNTFTNNLFSQSLFNLEHKYRTMCLIKEEIVDNSKCYCNSDRLGGGDMPIPLLPDIIIYHYIIYHLIKIIFLKINLGKILDLWVMNQIFNFYENL